MGPFYTWKTETDAERQIATLNNEVEIWEVAFECGMEIDFGMERTTRTGASSWTRRPRHDMAPNLERLHICT